MKNIICTKVEDLKEIEKEDFSVIAFDTETTSLEWFNQEIHGVSFTNGKVNVYLDVGLDINLLKEFKKIIENSVLIIAQNIVFDAKALSRYNIDITNASWFDTMVAEHLLDEQIECGLKSMAERYLNEIPLSWKEAREFGIHSKAFYKYALNDSKWVWEIFHIQKNRLEEQELVELMKNIEMPFLKVLMQMEMNGIMVDSKRVKKLLNKIKDDMIELEVEALKLLGEKCMMQMTLDGKMHVVSDFNIASSHHLRKKLYEELKLKPIGKTEKGEYSTDAKTLNELRNEHQAIEKILEFKRAQKLYTAFFLPLSEKIDPDERVRPSYKDIGTKTGRLSCASPNLQQLSKEEKDKYGLRKCFIAPEGKKLLTCDYDSQEMRICAIVTKEETMLEALNTGKDLHLTTANKFFNLEIPQEELYKDHPEYSKHEKKYKVPRDKSKTINFGIMYGKGPQGFAADFKISLEEAEEILNKYFNEYPLVKQAIEETKKEVLTHGEVKTLAGRKRRFITNEYGYHSNNSFREAFNFKIQGFAADMIRQATVAVDKIAKLKPEWELKLVGTVHDENLYEIKDEYVEEASREIKKAFESVYTDLGVKFLASIGVGSNYGDAK